MLIIVIMYIVFLVVILVSFITGIIITIIDSKTGLHGIDSANGVRKSIDNGSVIDNLVDSNVSNNQVVEQKNDSIKIQSVN